MEYKIRIKDRDFVVSFDEQDGSGINKVRVNGKEVDISSDAALSSIIVGSTSHQIKSFLVIDGKPARVEVDDHVFDISFPDDRTRSRKKAKKASGEIMSPLQGLVSSISVKQDQLVNEKDVLLTIEAMKMQNEIRSPVAGRVKKVSVAEGQTVKERELLVSIVSESND